MVENALHPSVLYDAPGVMCFRVLVHEVIRRALNLLTRRSPYWNVRLPCSANTAPSLVMFAIVVLHLIKIPPLQGVPANRRSPFELPSVFSSITGEVAHPHGARLDRPQF